MLTDESSNGETNKEMPLQLPVEWNERFLLVWNVHDGIVYLHVHNSRK